MSDKIEKRKKEVDLKTDKALVVSAWRLFYKTEDDLRKGIEKNLQKKYKLLDKGEEFISNIKTSSDNLKKSILKNKKIAQLVEDKDRLKRIKQAKLDKKQAKLDIKKQKVERRKAIKSKLVGKITNSKVMKNPIIKKILGGVKKMFSSFLAKFSFGVMILKFIFSPMGMMIIGFITSWFKNRVYNPYIKPFIDGLKSVITWIKETIGKIQKISDNIAEKIYNFPKLLGEKIQEIKDVVKEKINKVKENIGFLHEGYNETINDIVTPLVDSYEAIRDSFETMKFKTTEFFSLLPTIIKESGQLLVAKLLNVLGNALSNVVGLKKFAKKLTEKSFNMKKSVNNAQYDREQTKKGESTLFIQDQRKNIEDYRKKQMDRINELGLKNNDRKNAIAELNQRIEHSYKVAEYKEKMEKIREERLKVLTKKILDESQRLRNKEYEKDPIKRMMAKSDISTSDLVNNINRPINFNSIHENNRVVEGPLIANLPPSQSSMETEDFM
jgi:hypothetical protein